MMLAASSSLLGNSTLRVSQAGMRHLGIDDRRPQREDRWLAARVDALIEQIPAAQGHDGSINRENLSALQRLDEIVGLGPQAAQIPLAKLGLDMTEFPTAAHLVSWAQLSPPTVQSGPRTGSGRTGKGNSAASYAPLGA